MEPRTTNTSPQRQISAACEEDLVLFGDSLEGVGYKDRAQAEQRFALMLNVIREEREPVSILDLGCGLGHLLDHIRAHAEREHVSYSGLDISSRYIEAARHRHPEGDFILMDVLEPEIELPEYDYVIMNGLFNFRGEVSRDDMVDYWQRLISVAWSHCRRGVAFNVMSKIVDWERDDLFHLSFDEMARFVAPNLSRHFLVRHDYEAYEYTTYVYRSPSPS